MSGERFNSYKLFYKIRTGSFYAIVLTLLGLGISIPTFSVRLSLAETNSQRKTGGIMGNPSQKRGMEYGFDKGAAAGKKDKAAGLEPDAGRHEDFTNADKYYRYEFGSRASFVQGFRSGFAGGYQRAFGKDVKIKVSSNNSSTTNSSHEVTNTKSAAVKKSSQAPATVPNVSDAASDAL